MHDTRRAPNVAAAPDSLERRARIALLVSIAITVLLDVVPYGHVIGYPLYLVSTVVHEMGHGVAAVLAGARWESFHMYSDGSGYATIDGADGRLTSAFTMAGGLCGPAVMAALLFFCASRPRVARLSLGALGLLLAAVDIGLVRSAFGFGFVLILAAIAIFVAVKLSDGVSQILLVLLAVQLSLSVFSRGDYLFTKVAQTEGGTFPSDVANMSSALFLPYWFWGALCGLFSVAMLTLGATVFLRATRRRQHHRLAR